MHSLVSEDEAARSIALTCRRTDVDMESDQEEIPNEAVEAMDEEPVANSAGLAREGLTNRLKGKGKGGSKAVHRSITDVSQLGDIASATDHVGERREALW